MIRSRSTVLVKFEDELLQPYRLPSLNGDGSSQVQNLLFLDVTPLSMGFEDCRCHDEAHRTQHHLSHNEGQDIPEVR